MYLICKTRGYKHVVKLFPHEVSDLEPALRLLLSQDRAEHRYVTSLSLFRARWCVWHKCVFPQALTLRHVFGRHASTCSTWETRYVLLLWLSILVIVPFDLRTVDSSLADLAPATTQEADEDDAVPRSALIESIIAAGKGYLEEPGAVRDAAAVCLSRFLTRCVLSFPVECVLVLLPVALLRFGCVCFWVLVVAWL